ncbi:putative molybdenum carrier protein [Legionella micdadei]|uniref:Molybdenum carrier n=1 Tax=Legionella micdadei TaxID=451 RepID=A0A098GI18_LEGMI|nr:putative molybdenum carrier protein [Legionella micdadei]ARG98565.1 hypothetical protein B6N58_13365 [Legionella micdadei]ARH01309.1 hypothetical protein B6V88_13375 [Legionella micdadei]KTD27425.1 putative molybdenum carrier [Legionella micdadei]NSL19365.1 molybdenum cofactor carrier [Legionella micdadei]CEG62133.1 conserved protein of unknown function [Legionella micdadei]
MFKIVSGGQTGVDQAGLAIAEQMGIPWGGWCPKDGLDENGLCIRRQYPSLKETATADPQERTKLNIRDSDGTLVIVPTWPLPKEITDGTYLTITEAQQQNKPCLIIRLDEKERRALEQLRKWLKEHHVVVLNIAGPRESNCPGINKLAYEFLQQAFESLKPVI